MNTVGADKLNIQKELSFQSFYANKNSIPSKFISKDVEELDEIVLESKLDRQKRKKYGLPFRGKIVQMKKEVVDRFPTLSDFLNQNGFTSSVGSDGSYTVVANRYLSKQVVIFLDGIRMNDYNLFATKSLFDFEDIYMDTSPLANNFGISLDSGFGFASVIKLYTRKTPLLRVDNSKNFQSFTRAYFGFEADKTFYTPKYISYKIASFKDFGVIHWESDIKISKKENPTIKIVNTDLDETTFFIEGISSNGTLFSTIVNLK